MSCLLAKLLSLSMYAVFERHHQKQLLLFGAGAPDRSVKQLQLDKLGPKVGRVAAALCSHWIAITLWHHALQALRSDDMPYLMSTQNSARCRDSPKLVASTYPLTYSGAYLQSNQAIVTFRGQLV